MTLLIISIIAFMLGLLLQEPLKKLFCKHKEWGDWYPYQIQGDPTYQQRHCKTCGRMEIMDEEETDAGS